MGVQELFTELKNIHRRPSNDATNMAPFRVFLAIYRGKWPKNGLKINWRQKILSTSSSNNPHFGFVVSSYDTWGPDRAGFWNFHFCRKILTIFRSILAIFWNFAKNLLHKFAKNSGKMKISKSGSDRPSGIIRTHQKTKMGVMGPTSGPVQRIFPQEF